MNNLVWFILNDVYWKSYARKYFWKWSAVFALIVQSVNAFFLMKKEGIPFLETLLSGETFLHAALDIITFFPVLFYIALGSDLLKKEKAAKEEFERQKEDD